MLEVLKSPFFVTKVVELALSIICAFLIAGILPSDTIFQIEIVHAAIYGFILVNIVVVIAFILEEPHSSRLSIIISGAATASFLVATVIMCSNYMANDVSRRILAASLIALLNALIYGADCFFTCKYVTE